MDEEDPRRNRTMPGERLNYEVGDIVKLKKPHPCGSSEWEILRVGADFRLKCTCRFFTSISVSLISAPPFCDSGFCVLPLVHKSPEHISRRLHLHICSGSGMDRAVRCCLKDLFRGTVRRFRPLSAYWRSVPGYTDVPDEGKCLPPPPLPPLSLRT